MKLLKPIKVTRRVDQAKMLLRLEYDPATSEIRIKTHATEIRNELTKHHTQEVVGIRVVTAVPYTVPDMAGADVLVGSFQFADVVRGDAGIYVRLNGTLPGERRMLIGVSTAAWRVFQDKVTSGYVNQAILNSSIVTDEMSIEIWGEVPDKLKLYETHID